MKKYLKTGLLVIIAVVIVYSFYYSVIASHSGS